MPPIPKPEPRKRQKARTARQHAAARKACVDAVWKRADHLCECTGCQHCNPSGTEPTGLPQFDKTLDQHPDDHRSLVRTHGFSVTWSCGKHLVLARSSQAWREVGHVHEVIPRSRGGSDTDPENCILLCYQCHFSGPSGAHRKTVRRAATSLR